MGVLLAEELALAANAPGEQRRGQRVVVASLANHTWTGPGQSFPSCCIDEYLEYLHRRDYTCVLIDGALLQISFTFHRARLIQHRMCYYPCPVLIARDELTGEVLLEDLVEMRMAAELRESVRLRSPLRFDFDQEAAREGHSASHLHLSYTECRWPVYGPLSLGHFVRFVFRHFYPEAWAAHSALREWTIERGTRTVTSDEQRELYIDCQG